MNQIFKYLHQKGYSKIAIASHLGIDLNDLKKIKKEEPSTKQMKKLRDLLKNGRGINKF